MNALDFSGADLAGKVRVFAKGVVAAAELEVAVDVDEGLQRDINAEGAGFAADDHAVEFGVSGAEGGGDAHGGCFTLRWMAGEHAWRAIGKAQTRNAETRNAGEIACLTLIDGRVFLRAVDERQFFLERHLAEQFVDPGVACNHRHSLRQRKSCA